MNPLMSILAHPLQFAFGLFLLLGGVWLLRKAGIVPVSYTHLTLPTKA